MQFHIDMDHGHVIGGWVIPENPSDDAEILISVPDRPDMPLKANVLRADIVELGMHPTGMVGFQIDQSILADIERIKSLSITDQNSGLKIYSRSPQELFLQQKAIFLDIGGMPQFKMLRRCMTFFGLNYPIAERFSLETAYSLIGNHLSNSIAFYGQLNWVRFGTPAQDAGYRAFALLRDPFEELAERLLFFNFLLRRPKSNSHEMIMARNEPLLPILDAMNSPTPRALLNSFKGLTLEQRRLLRSPMTATLACSPEEEPQRRSVSIALEHLAQFHVVGTRARIAEYARLVDATIGVPILANVSLEALPDVPDFAARLSEMGAVIDLLDEDIALYSFVTEALEVADKAEQDLINQ